MPVVHPSSTDAYRDAVNKALALLTQDQRGGMPNIEVVPPVGPFETTAPSPRFGRQTVDGYSDTVNKDPNIYITGNSDNYHKAQQGDKQALIRLASDIVHERAHLEHGKDEMQAYDAQLAILKALGADQKLIKSVQASRDFVASPEAQLVGGIPQ